MKHYAQIGADGICFSQLMTSGQVEGENIVPITEQQYADGVAGLRYVDGAFEPLPAPPEARHITVGAFYDRFGAEKYPILASTDRGVIAVIRDAQVRSYIDLDRDDLPAGLAVIQAAGHQIDPEAILDAPVQPGERP